MSDECGVPPVEEQPQQCEEPQQPAAEPQGESAPVEPQAEFGKFS